MAKYEKLSSAMASKAALLLLFLALLLVFILLPSLPLKLDNFTSLRCSVPEPRAGNGVIVSLGSVKSPVDSSRLAQNEKFLAADDSDEDEDEGLVTKDEHVKWVRAQMELARLGDPGKTAHEWHRMRKGINPRTREQQLFDLRRYHGISHYDEHENRTRLPCPGELLVEEHHSNYGEPWAGGRDIFEFLVQASGLKKHHRVLEMGCGTLRVGLHFIRYLAVGQFHCLEKDPLSITTALLYELPAQGLLHKRPLILRSEDMDITGLGSGSTYNLIYSSAVFIHIPDSLVWLGLQRLAPRLVLNSGRLFVSHNMKFCTRMPADECKSKLAQLGLLYLGKHTHDSLLFNHYEIWHEFSRLPKSP
ncbi:hypothetical protein O6H91_01G065700 [Diphasiastrum complanatum]|uniref:Uncharacterized protein n=1 Tax=Diphasiastrum complanatum TaxID=34168 RepID=A0ACC2ERV1_DIPCM|nr:hypothetical protein O6H91_01G065700 [Diphasiastrum complanatum]